MQYCVIGQRRALASWNELAHTRMHPITHPRKRIREWGEAVRVQTHPGYVVHTLRRYSGTAVGVRVCRRAHVCVFSRWEQWHPRILDAVVSL